MDYFVWKQLLKNLVLPPTGALLVAGLGLVLVARRKTRLSGVVVCALGLVALWVLATPIAADSLVRWAERYPALDPGEGGRRPGHRHSGRRRAGRCTRVWHFRSRCHEP